MSMLLKLQIYPEELLYIVNLDLKLIYGDGELVASSSSLFEEMIYNEREMKSVMLVYFKCYMILILHDVIDIVLLLEGKPMGAVSAFTSRNLSLPTFLIS